MSGKTDAPDNEAYSEAETIARREAALTKMLATPHKPHKPRHSSVSVEYGGKKGKTDS